MDSAALSASGWHTDMCCSELGIMQAWEKTPAGVEGSFLDTLWRSLEEVHFCTIFGCT